MVSGDYKVNPHRERLARKAWDLLELVLVVEGSGYTGLGVETGSTKHTMKLASAQVIYSGSLLTSSVLRNEKTRWRDVPSMKRRD
jgi:hypothetical protein